MRFALSLSRRFEAKGATERSAFTSGRASIPGFTDWNVDRAVSDGMEKVTWVFKAVHTIASNQARLPMVVREEDRWKGQILEDHFLLPFLNRKANPFEKVVGWRYRVSCLLLLSRTGVFVEILRSRIGEPLGLFILPPSFTKPVKDPDVFVSGYEVHIPGQPKRTVPAEDVMWFRLPHPTDPYRSLTPLDACGLAVESDWWARVYNRNFMLNDGRPGGLIVLKGNNEMDDDDLAELKARYNGPGGGVKGAGRTSVLHSEGGADFVDTAVNPRDAQYLESRKSSREEIFAAFGVNDTVAGLTAGKTFDNADADQEEFWRDTMLFHLELFAQPFDDLDGDDDAFTGFDVSGVEVLQRDKRQREEYHLREFQAHLITVDEYREATGRDPLGGRASQLVRPLNLVPLDELPERAKVIPIRAHALPAVVEKASGRAPTIPAGLPALLPKPQQSTAPETLLALKQPDEDTNVDFGQWKVSARRLESRRRERTAKMAAWERTAQASLKRLFARQRRVTVEKLKGAKSRQSWFADRDGELVAVKQVDPDAIFDRLMWNEQLAEDARAWIGATFEDFGGDVADTLNGGAKDVEVTFDLEDPEVRRLIEAQVNRLVGVNDTTYDAIKATLAEGVGKGETITKLAKRIEVVFSDASRVRSEMIARTEVLSAANSASLTAARGAGVEGMTKVWLSAHDKRTRDDHRNADGQEKGMDEPFIVGGHPMQHPGDPAAPPNQTIRCRCTTIFSTPDSLLL